MIEKNEELVALSENLDLEISKLKLAIDNFEKDMIELQNGDGNKSYWSGENAYMSIKSCLGYLEHNKYLLNELNRCSEYLNNLSNQ